MCRLARQKHTNQADAQLRSYMAAAVSLYDCLAGCFALCPLVPTTGGRRLRSLFWHSTRQLGASRRFVSFNFSNLSSPLLPLLSLLLQLACCLDVWMFGWLACWLACYPNVHLIIAPLLRADNTRLIEQSFSANLSLPLSSISALVVVADLDDQAAAATATAELLKRLRMSKTSCRNNNNKLPQPERAVHLPAGLSACPALGQPAAELTRCLRTPDSASTN